MTRLQTDALGTTERDDGPLLDAPLHLHRVQLTGLSPATRYHYKVVSNDLEVGIFEIVTPPAADQENLHLVAMSNMRGDRDKYLEIVEQGIIGYLDGLSTTGALDVPTELAMVLVAGNMLRPGIRPVEIQQSFFEPGSRLMAQVPFYPSFGTSDLETSGLYDYFQLPEGGDVDGLGRWWHLDRANVRIVSLDSNIRYRELEQLSWLDERLMEAAIDDDIDFVIVQVNQAFLGRQEEDRGTIFTSAVITRLDGFSGTTGKPSIHLTGSSFGYVRGQSAEVPHLWVDVAAAAGSIDGAEDIEHADFDIITAIQSEWGFVDITSVAGANPRLEVRRISRGNLEASRDNEVRDDVVLRRYNNPAARPVASVPPGPDVSPECTVLLGSRFDDPDGDTHLTTHWQLSRSCTDWTNDLILDRRNYDRTRSDGGPPPEMGSLATAGLPSLLLQPLTSYCYRVRYRDSSLGWSEWSVPAPFTTGSSNLGVNLLANPDAEDGTNGWQILTGPFQALASDECGVPEPHGAGHLFAVGGTSCTEPADYGEVFQIVDLDALGPEIDEGGRFIAVGGYLYSPDGEAAMQLVLYDREGRELAQSGRISTSESEWTLLIEELPIPVGARKAALVLTASRHSGTNTNSYFDDLELRLIDRAQCGSGSAKP